MVRAAAWIKVDPAEAGNGRGRGDRLHMARQWHNRSPGELTM